MPKTKNNSKTIKLVEKYLEILVFLEEIPPHGHPAQILGHIIQMLRMEWESWEIIQPRGHPAQILGLIIRDKEEITQEHKEMTIREKMEAVYIIQIKHKKQRDNPY